MAAASRGRFITLEGGEGAGKSTQSRRLAAWLAGQGLPVLRTREPGGSAGAEAIRTLLLGQGPWDPVAEAMLMFAARREHLARSIRPALAAGIWVVSDRFVDSTLAYQGHGQGLPEPVWRQLADLALEADWPDLTLVLDLPPGAGMARATARGALNRYEKLGAAFHARVHEGFRAIAAADPRRCRLIDAGQGPEAVTAAILAEVAALRTP
jgi:dTMP kinase